MSGSGLFKNTFGGRVRLNACVLCHQVFPSEKRARRHLAECPKGRTAAQKKRADA